MEKEKLLRVVVDSYYVTDEYLQKIRAYAPIVYMDDLATFAYSVDILVNYNIYGEKLSGRVMIHQNVKEMEQLMHNCDMAISAVSSMLYELCACGIVIPTITYALADNQILEGTCF